MTPGAASAQRASDELRALRRRVGMVLLGFALLSPSRGHAQSSGGQRTAANAFAVEAAGATAGSVVGVVVAYGIAAAVDPCGVEELTCFLRRAGVMGAASAFGATGGAMVAGRRAGTDPSLAGAALGSLVGVAAGLGVVKLLEEADVSNRWMVLLGYSVTQGALTGAGSRLLRR